MFYLPLPVAETAMTVLAFSALILAGGRSTRLGGTPKALLTDGRHTLLENVLFACQAASYRVVVGPDSLDLPQGVLLTCESPAYGGPAAGITAGTRELSKHLAPELQHQHWVLLLSCDLPRARYAVPRLIEAAAGASQTRQGIWAIADGIPQPLLGIYRLDSLASAFSKDTANASVRRFLAQLEPQGLPLEAAWAADIDTWDAAQAAGYSYPATPPAHTP